PIAKNVSEHFTSQVDIPDSYTTFMIRKPQSRNVVLIRWEEKAPIKTPPEEEPDRLDIHAMCISLDGKSFGHVFPVHDGQATWLKYSMGASMLLPQKHPTGVSGLKNTETE